MVCSRASLRWRNYALYSQICKGKFFSCKPFVQFGLTLAGVSLGFRLMSKSAIQSHIRLRGVRHNNLKNFDLTLPLRKLIVVTGLSGSGKSSLAFDTLFAEGQRRYIETFS